MLTTAAAERFPKSRSYIQGQRSRGQLTCPCAPTLYECPHTQTGLCSINCLITACATRFPSYFQVQGHSSKFEDHWGEMICPCTTTPRGQSTYQKWELQHQQLRHGMWCIDRWNRQHADEQSESSMPPYLQLKGEGHNKG